MNIGNWVRRSGGKWHLVESIIGGDAITKCGRRMKEPLDEVAPVEPLTRMIGQPQNCQNCTR